MNVISTYFIDPIKNHYVDFGGKATRTQFWLFFLFCVIFFLVIGKLLSFFGAIGSIIDWICTLALILPNLAIAARRLRDGGFTPWLLLLALIPAIGWIILLVLFLMPSKK